MFNHLALRRAMILQLILAAAGILAVQVNAESTKLKCTISRVEAGGKSWSDSQELVFVFDDREETLQYNGEHCGGVKITEESIHGACAVGVTDISRTSGRIHIHSERLHGCSGPGCNKPENRYYDKSDSYGTCEKREQPKKRPDAKF